MILKDIVKRQKCRILPHHSGLEVSLFFRIQDSYTVSELTAEVARAVFRKGNLYLTLFDTFGSLFADPDFAAMFPNNGQPALSPVRLMLILIL